MPDRELTKEETQKFLHEHVSGKVFRGLKLLREENTKPSLHDLCILELEASVDGMKHFIIQQGRELKILKDRIKLLEVKKKGD